MLIGLFMEKFSFQQPHLYSNGMNYSLFCVDGLNLRVTLEPQLRFTEVRSSHSQVFNKTYILKTPEAETFFNKVADQSLQIYSKKFAIADFFLWNFENFSEQFFHRVTIGDWRNVWIGNSILTKLSFLMSERPLSFTLKETRNSYFCVTPKNHGLMFVSWKH